MNIHVKRAGAKQLLGATGRPWRRLDQGIGLAILIALTCYVLPGKRAWAQESTKSDYERLGEAVGKTLYAFAWPTATYRSASFGGIFTAPAGVNVVFRLHGKSAFDGSDLWTDVVLQIRNWQIVDLKWGKNNAVIAQPGETMKALGEALDDLNKASAQSRPSGHQFVFTNRCSHPLRLAISYRGLDAKWHSAGWWTFEGGASAVLKIDGQTLTTMDEAWLYYAETTDGSGLAWRGDSRVSFDGRDLPMSKVGDADGDREWGATCP